MAVRLKFSLRKQRLKSLMKYLVITHVVTSFKLIKYLYNLVKIAAILFVIIT